MISIPIQARRSFHVFAERDHAKTISEPYNATAATCGATLNVLMFPRMNINNRLSSTDDTWYCNACTFKWISDSFFSDSTGDSLNNSTSAVSDTSEPDVVADYKASIAAYYKFNLSIAHQNINSLQNKMDEIRALLNQELFDILVLTETKIDSSYNNSLFQHPLYRILQTR